MSAQNAGTHVDCTRVRKVKEVGDADDGALCFESDIFKFVLFIRDMSLSSWIPLTASRHTLMTRRFEMPIRCQYMLSLHSSLSYFPLRLSPQQIFRYTSLFSAGEVQDEKRNLCCSIESNRCLMGSDGYWAPGVYSINPKFVPALVQYKSSTYQFSQEI